MSEREDVRQKIDRIERDMEVAGEIPSPEELRAIADKLLQARERLLPRRSCLRRLASWVRRPGARA